MILQGFQITIKRSSDNPIGNVINKIKANNNSLEGANDYCDNLHH